MNLLLLHLFARDAGARLAGATMGAADWFAPVLSIPLNRRDHRAHLIVVLESPGPFCFLDDAHPLGGATGVKRFNHLEGLKVTAVSQVDGDRVLRLDTGPDEDGRHYGLVFHLYGGRGRALLQREGETIETLGGPGPVKTKDPDDRPAGIDRAGVSSVRAALRSRAPQSVVPGLDRHLVEAFATGDDANDAEALIAFRDRLAAGSVDYDLVTRRVPSTAVPVPHGASSGENRYGPFEDAVTACAGAGRATLARAREEMISRLSRPARARVEALNKLATHLEADLKRAQGYEHVRREAEVLAAYQSRIRPGTGRVELPDVYDPEVRMTIELDPSMPIAAQVEKRFKRAAKLEKSREHAGRRLELVGRERGEIEAALSRLHTERDFKRALERIEEMRSRFDLHTPAPKRTARRGESPARTHRRLELSAQWYVMVGRSNLENDELTFRIARPTDWWLHAQGVPGSHVVLRSRGTPGNPPRAILERAAAIAAHFSRARHSSLVPVIYTQRKYVRKFRGAKPGQVRCEREKMLMVAPALPDEDPSPGGGGS